MKIKLLIICACLTIGFLQGFSQAFTAGNIVAYRYGDGSAYTNGNLVPVFLDEYTPAGVLVRSRAIPTVDVSTNYKLTGLLKLNSGLYQQEGMSTLSQDGKYITIFGYNAAVGSTVPTTSNGLVVGIIAADGSYNSSTTLSNAPQVLTGSVYSGGLGAPRSAIVNGTDIYANGFNTGLFYTSVGAASTATRINTEGQQNSPRTIGIFNNSLYVPTGSSGVLAYTTPPTTVTTLSTRILSGSPTTNQIAAFPIGNRILIYTIDDAANTIRRFNTNSAGDTFLTLGTTIASTDVIKGITGVANVVGSNTVITLYVSTWGDTGAGAVSSKVLTFTDTFVTPTTNPSAPTSTTALTTFATAPAGTMFRSVTMAPQGSTGIGLNVLPVKLSSFSGKKDLGGIQLGWSTASEKSNSYFEILRSADGKTFKSIGKTSGKGNATSGQSYSFIDGSFVAGTNYYQLNQVDVDGTITKSDVIAVETAINRTDLAVTANSDGNSLNVSIFSPKSTSTTLQIFSLNGRKLVNLTVSLENGGNTIKVPFKASTGIYFIRLTSGSERITKKFFVK